MRPGAEDRAESPEAAPAGKKQLFSQDRAETKKVSVDGSGTGPTFTIGAGLPPEQEDALVAFLRANKDVFAWKASDLSGVPRGVIEHHLAVCPNARPVKQKARRQAPEKQAFIVQEVHKLQEAGVIREVRHPEWLANPVIVPKKGGKERMCVDFTSLNKACPQDPFPLPRIDQIVDSTAECDLLCFLDAFSGYHQIKMAAEDVEKTAFISPCGVFCYTCMPFGLRSAGATFQRLMRITLGPQLGRNAEAYVDDIVVKSREARTLIKDLEETFANLREVSLKLNPDKCVFGVPSGKLLGFLVSHRGIEANPEKIKAIEKMRPPRNLKEMQRLAGCVASLGRFISKLGERALPFFKLMKRTGSFEWTPEADAAFESLKRYLTSPPIMVAPRFREPLVLYLAATPQTASAALVAVREERVITKEKLPGTREPSGLPGPSGPRELQAPPGPSMRPTGAPEPHVSLQEQAPAEATRLVEHPVYFVSTVLRDARALPYAAKASPRTLGRLQKAAPLLSGPSHQSRLRVPPGEGAAQP